MNHRDTVIDILTATTGDKDSAARMVHLVEHQAYGDGYVRGYLEGRKEATVDAEQVTLDGLE